jgi:uncharacterized OsmC-like protein
VHDREHDPFHGIVAPGEHEARGRFGIHRALGGDHDLPNPGDMLCAALAACLDSTLRIIADRLGIGIAFVEVAAHAEADVRGTLLVDRAVPVGFQRMQCSVQLQPAAGADPVKLQKLLVAAEHSCVVLQTMRRGVEVQTQFNSADDRHATISQAQPERSV